MKAACTLCGRNRKLNDASECKECARDWDDDDSDYDLNNPGHIAHDH